MILQLVPFQGEEELLLPSGVVAGGSVEDDGTRLRMLCTATAWECRLRTAAASWRWASCKSPSPSGAKIPVTMEWVLSSSRALVAAMRLSAARPRAAHTRVATASRSWEAAAAT